MRSIIFVILVLVKICSSSVLFRLKGNNENITIKSVHFLGTMHIPNVLIWPYLSNEILRILHESDQIWMEHDFTNSEVSKYIYGCSVDRMSIKKRARLRAYSWSQFLNETTATSNNQSTTTTNNLERWRQWFLDNEIKTNNNFWRNRTISNDTIFDHRIILEAYQRGIYVGSLEPIPRNCSSAGNTTTATIDDPIYQQIFSRVYNCDMIDEDFVREIFQSLDVDEMRIRNQQMTEHIRKLLTTDPDKNYVFAVGAAHLFGNISIVQMLKDQYGNDYFIEQIESPSSNYPYQNCTDEEFQRLVDQTKSAQNVTMTKRFFQYTDSDFYTVKYFSNE